MPFSSAAKASSDPRSGELWRAGQAAWPTVDVPFGAFRTFAQGCSAQPERAGDLYLACACALRLAPALEAFEAAFGTTVRTTIRRATRDESQWEDLRQAVTERLFVASPRGPAKISQYSGRAPLEHWLRVVTLRTVRSAQRKRTDTPAQDTLFLDIMDERTAEEALVQANLMSLYKAAFERAFEQLTARERTILRLYVIEGLTIDQLARLLQVHRATAARWVASARAQLSQSTRAFVKRNGKLSPSEVESAVRLIQSKIDLSLERVMRETSGGA